MKTLTFTVPDKEVRNVTRTVTKRLEDCTAEEVMLAYRQNKPEDFTKSAEQIVLDEAYEMPMEELLDRANAQLKEKADAELEIFRTQNAYTWMATEPRYKQTPENAQLITDMLNRLGMRGTVTDLAYCFDELNAQRKLDTNFVPPAPKPMWTTEELSQMPLEDVKAAIEQMHRDGIY